MYKLKVHKQFIKDLKKSNLNQTNTEKLFTYISLLLSGEDLPVEARDRNLKGE